MVLTCHCERRLLMKSSICNQKWFHDDFHTHDMELAAVVADEIFVMRNSKLVERAKIFGDYYSVFHDPYSRMLLEASGLANVPTDWNEKTNERTDLQ